VNVRELRKPHNEYLYDLFNRYCSGDKIENNEKGGHVARMRERKGVYRVLVGKPEEKRPLGRTRRRWEDNIKMDLQKLVCGGVDWIELAQDREKWLVIMNAVIKFRVP
jgi:hypothetical protein